MTQDEKEILLAQEHTKTKVSVQASSSTMAPLNSVSMSKRGSTPTPTPEAEAETESVDTVLFINRKKLIYLLVKSNRSKQKQRQDLGIMILVQTLVSLVKKENETIKSTAWLT